MNKRINFEKVADQATLIVSWIIVLPYSICEIILSFMILLLGFVEERVRPQNFDFWDKCYILAKKLGKIKYELIFKIQYILMLGPIIHRKDKGYADKLQRDIDDGYEQAVEELINKD